MHAEDAVLAIITALPDRRIKGKKRLQKLAFFLKSAGAKFDARFDIRDYGPFSREIAAAAQALSLKGRVEEREEPIGAGCCAVWTVFQRSIWKWPPHTSSSSPRVFPRSQHAREQSN